MSKLAVPFLVLATGCATIFNHRYVDLKTDPGVEVEGGTSDVDQRESHQVTYPDGRTCTLRPGVSVGYVLVDLFLTGPIGLIVDGVTGNWTVLKGDCDGVELER